MYFWERKNGIRDSDEKKYGMRDSREKGAGMRDQDPPFQTLYPWLIVFSATEDLVRRSKSCVMACNIRPTSVEEDRRGGVDRLRIISITLRPVIPKTKRGFILSCLDLKCFKSLLNHFIIPQTQKLHKSIYLTRLNSLNLYGLSCLVS